MNLKDLAELVRAPAALSVPGDTMAGGARGPAPAVSSVCLYWAGMALNDYADRALDAKERPERPIPSGRVAPWEALALAAGLTGAGLAVAAVTGGRRRLAVAVPLAVTVWAYDLKLKDTPVGPAAMAAARGLDVLLGGGPGALPAAAAITAHTYGLTMLSRGEVDGGGPAQLAIALAATATVTAIAALPHRDRAAIVGLGLVAAYTGVVGGAQLHASAPPGAVTAGAGVLGLITGLVRRDRSAGARVGLVAAYAGLVGGAQLRAAANPDAATVRAAVGAGVLGLIPLQAAFTARRGHPAAAAALAAVHPLARLLARKVSPT
ncbi:SCO3242 family prenyltransferase [Thermomonospora umbrina]|uniref:4-hydroxybenzoate polyprenyltransferase n=1 Tax=Thermomonospora umbrina TaxID=111806 RepID=A0A3D9SPY8_9ACTN|nr:UbiA family prenyltransferase [Thermomonospora umbrina]REE97968.1 4-hydroxybenzoate polyprenyltransferase [Thermomonospora umbrina]